MFAHFKYNTTFEFTKQNNIDTKKQETHKYVDAF